MMRRIYLHICRQFVGVGLILLIAVASAWAVDIVLITHPDTEVNELSPQDVQMIFLGKKTVWQDGSPIVPLVQLNSETTETFLDEMLKITPKQYYLYWRKALFTGRGIPPDEVANDRAMIERLLETPGSIGYVSADALDNRVRKVPSR